MRGQSVLKDRGKEKNALNNFDKTVFIERIQFLIDKRCDGDKQRFNRIVGQRSADYRWRTDRNWPRVQALVKICNHFNVTMDWLLGLPEDTKYQYTAQPNIDESPMSEDTIDLIKHYQRLLDVYERLFEHLFKIQFQKDQQADPGGQDETKL